MKMFRIAMMGMMAAMVAAPVMAQAQNMDVTKLLHVGGEGAWDYLTFDAQGKRMFVPRTTHTLILDWAGKTLGDIPGQKNAHGVAIVPSVGRGFITDGGGDGAILIFDLKTYAVLGKLAAMPDADGIIYDSAMGRVLAVSGDGGTLMTFKPDIDPKSGKIDPPIVLGGKPEFLVSDGMGNAYINLEDKAMVAKVDLKQRKVVARWPVAPGGHPVGLSMDAKTHRLFIGCRNPQLLVVMSAEDGKVIASLPIGMGVDATKVDNGRAFASCFDGTLVVVRDVNGKYVVEQKVKTPLGARTMDIDPTTHTIYLPTAEMLPVAAGSTARPKPKPDTFEIVEVSAK